MTQKMKIIDKTKKRAKPEEYDTVLLYVLFLTNDGKRVDFEDWRAGFWTGKEWHIYDDDLSMFSHVTHWQPLPPKPED